MSSPDIAETKPLGLASSATLVFLGGAMGTLLRFLLTQSFGGAPLDLGNTLANLIGSFCMGALATWLSLRLPDNDWIRPLFMVGLLGGFTTFSGAILAIVQGLGEANIVHSLLVFAVSVLGSVLMCAAGAWVVARGLGSRGNPGAEGPASEIIEPLDGKADSGFGAAKIEDAPNATSATVTTQPSPTVQAIRARLDAAAAGQALDETDIERRFPAGGGRRAQNRHEPGRTSHETTAPFDPFADGGN